MEEESVKFHITKDVFYNPAMKLCRSISSLAVGAIDEKLELVDAFCASGIRGIRYAKENKNVKHTTFIDIDSSAIALAKKNAKSNKIKFEGVKGNISKLAFECTADFLEIDPFGTPSPYLVDALRFFNPKKTGYLSVTATDVAVLCGGKVAACMKNYHARPLNNEFTHESGLRILMKKIAETASEFNFGISPLISFSNRHYLKTVFHLKRSADLAYDCLKKVGYISYCRQCGLRSKSDFPQACKNCGTTSEFTGPLWLGELHDISFLRRMTVLNNQRNYSDIVQINKMLSLMEGEVGMPPYYYNVHSMCKRQKCGEVPKLDLILTRIRESGYKAFRTHFSDVSIKSNMPYNELLDVIAWKN